MRVECRRDEQTPHSERRQGELIAPLDVERGLRMQSKIFSVDAAKETTQTRVYVQLFGQNDRGRVQQNATWECTWRPHADGNPRLRAIAVIQFEEVYDLAANALFADSTASVFRNCESFSKQIRHGIAYWRRRLDRRLGTDLTALQGIAVGDANGDGLEDVYVCQQGGLPNRLYVQQHDGTVVDQSAAAGVDWLAPSRCALFVDLDNDGDQDLALVTNGQVLFHENDGTGRFAVRAKWPAMTKLYSLAAADYDGDADLDLYVCGFNGKELPVPYHDANNGGPNALLRERR